MSENHIGPSGSDNKAHRAPTHGNDSTRDHTKTRLWSGFKIHQMLSRSLAFRLWPLSLVLALVRDRFLLRRSLFGKTMIPCCLLVKWTMSLLLRCPLTPMLKSAISITCFLATSPVGTSNPKAKRKNDEF